MAKPLLADELWVFTEPLLSPMKVRRFRYSGRKPLSHRRHVF